MSTVEELIKQGELAAEHQQHLEALQAYNQAILLAGENKDYKGLVMALAQRLIIYKHKYQLTGDKTFLELLKGDVEAGTAIVTQHNIDGHPKAVMALRRGDYFFETGNFAEAAKYYQEAVDNLPDSDSIARPEFLGHLGLALSLNGENKGLDFLNEGLSLAENDTALRPFHKQIIISGLHMRLAEAYSVLDDKAKAQEHIKIAEQISAQLESEHNMGMRAVQVSGLKQKLLIN